MNFNESQTQKNLAKSFAAECQAGARYQFMATQAQQDKLFYVKDTLKLIAKNEMAHAKLFYDYIVENSGECKVPFEADYPYVDPKLDTSLSAEKEIEKEEADKLYPEFSAVARKEGFSKIAESYELVAKVEKTHEKMLKLILDGYKDDSFYKSSSKRLLRCSNCGYVELASSPWKKCPICSLETGYIAIDFNDIFCSVAKT